MFKVSLIFLILVLSCKSFAISGKDINKTIKNWLKTKGIESNPNFSNKKKMNNCKNDLKFRSVYSNYSLIEVTCFSEEGLQDWKIFIKPNLVKKNYNPVSKKKKKIAKTLNRVVRLERSLEKDKILTAGDLKITNENIRKQFFYDKSQLVGRKLKQNLKYGQIIQPRHLQKKFDINEGDAIVISSKIGRALVSSGGISNESGNIGDLLEVTNNRSGKKIKGYLKKNKIIYVYR